MSLPRSDQSQRLPIITVGTPRPPPSIDTALRGETTRSRHVISAATSSKSFMRSSHSQRWIVTPNLRSAMRRSRSQSSYWRLTHSTPGIAKSSPHWSSCVYSRRRSAVFRRLRHDMPTNGPGPISARRAFHAATRSGSATMNEFRSGKWRATSGSVAAGSRRDRVVEVVHRLAVDEVERLRANLGGRERTCEQRGEARVGLDDRVARGVDQVGIARREQDLVADALLAVAEHAAVAVLWCPARP